MIIYSPKACPNILGNKYEEPISGPCAILTNGAINEAPLTAKTRSYRANWVKAKPITFPWTIENMGLEDVIIF